MTINNEDLQKIKESSEEFFTKMTIFGVRAEAKFSSEESDILDMTSISQEDRKETIDLEILSDEPQILIGQGGQTLFEIQRLLRMVLNKKLGKIFYLNLDINGYKNKKIENLKWLAKDLADQVAFTKETKILSPMPAYERRILHKELAKRADVISESQGEGLDRHLVIKSKS